MSTATENPGAPSDHRPMGWAMRWGVKRRFLQYIARMPDGHCSVTDGAEPDPGSHFAFAVDSVYRPSSDSRWSVRCRGDVRFAGHHGFLFVRIADPLLTIDGDRGLLSVLDGPDSSATYRELVEFDLVTDPGGASGCLLGTNVRLTAVGSSVFNDVYAVGEPFDDFTLDIGALAHPHDPIKETHDTAR